MALTEEERAEIRRKGGIVTSLEEFLGLDEAQMEVVEMGLRISREIKRRREAAGMTQAQLAERLGVSQPRIPAIEGSGRASLDTVALAFLATGGTLDDLAAVIAGKVPEGSAKGEAVAGSIR